MANNFINILSRMGLSEDILHLLKHVYDGILITLKDSTIIFVNNSYSRIFGVPPERVLGRKLSQLEPNSIVLKAMKSGNEAIHHLEYIASLNERLMCTVLLFPAPENFIGSVSLINKFDPKILDQDDNIDHHRYIETYLDERLSLKNPLPPPFSKIVGQDVRFRIALLKANKASKADFPVLVLGESGTGKELIARAIHESSHRRDHKFVALNCAAITNTLVESELFGYEGGAFTGASRVGKRGLFDLANRGSLFLDEIADFELTTQGKILRVLEEKEFKRVGGEREIHVDTRIISATNRKLETMMFNGKFREDLYYRINTMAISIPPLRERLRDLELLVNHFVSIFCSQYQKEVQVHDDAMEILYAQNWPGNVRELRSVLDYAINMTDTQFITPQDLPPYLMSNSKTLVANNLTSLPKESISCQQNTYRSMMDSFERDLIEITLKKSHNRTEAIKFLGISRRAFYLKLNKHGFI